MILLWCLCVCLLLVGLAIRPLLRDAWEGVRLHLVGERVRVPVRHVVPAPGRPVAPSSRHGSLPPPRVITRSGP
jgi:hypothetical protein